MPSAYGGYLRGPWWRYMTSDDENIRRCFVIAWGEIIKEPSEKYKDLRKVKFVIKTGRGAGRNEKHLVCVSYGEQMSAVVMRALEKGDIVFVAGTWIERKWKTKKGETLEYECKVNFIIPQGLIGFMLELYSAPEAQKMVQDRRNEEADVWESDDDDL